MRKSLPVIADLNLENFGKTSCDDEIPLALPEEVDVKLFLFLIFFCISLIIGFINPSHWAN